ncbi:glutathione binding-like protein [Alphaproteobacteria bacterium]|nr:glutathione binding-like protein [Alphaproteobacteria bacterium]
MYDVYYWPTPNGKKITVQLEEMGASYTIIKTAIALGDQFDEAFLEMNPNARMPLLVDHSPVDGGAPLPVFESGAIMIYLADKTGQFMPTDQRGRSDVIQWVMWQMANQGPKMGERNHYYNYARTEHDQSYAKRRYDDEVHRIFGVMNHALHDRAYLASPDYSIADMACYPWAINWQAQGIDLHEFAHVKRWLDALQARPAVQKGMAVGAEYSINPDDYSEAERERIMALIFNQRARPIGD